MFLVRIYQIGGIDLTYQEHGNQMLQPLRDQLSQNIDQMLPFPQSALLSGILLGTQKDLPYRFKNQLQTTSTIHIVVVSGQNLTILAGFIMSLSSFLGRKKTIGLTIAVIILYSLLTGLGVPVIRAAVMAILTYLAVILGKEGDGWWVLILTAAAMLLFNPNWLFNISFQLSFLATFGVVVMAPIIIRRLKIVPKVIREDLGVSLAAQLVTLPVIAYNFGQFSVVGVLVNSLVLWSIPIVMIGGLITLVFGLIDSLSGMIIGLLPSVLLTYFINIVELFSQVPGASLKLGETRLIFWLGYYLILGTLLWLLASSQKKEIDQGSSSSRYKLG